MTETILALVPVYGLALIALATFLSCLALPIPSSLIMLSAGGFGAAGDLVLWQAGAAALAGAVAGIRSATGSGSSASGRSRGAGCRRNAPR
jgi:membrane-associated protein